MSTRITATVDPARSLTDVRTADGHRVTMDADPPQGGGSAARPKETLLAALAGCTAMDVASILRKKRQRADRYSLHLVAEKADEHPRIFTRVVVEHRVEGDVAPDALRRAVELSATRYCPVNAMLSGTVEVEHRYRLDTEGRPGVSELVATTGPKDRPTTT